MTTKCKSTW